MFIKKEHTYFLKVVSVSFLFLSLVAFFLLWIVSGGVEKISPKLPFYIFLFFIALFFLFTVVFISSLVIKYDKKQAIFLNFARLILIKFLYPLAFFIASVFRIDREKMQNSFIEINNFLLFSAVKRAPHDRILILLPHCLQLHNCKAKVTEDIHSCLSCGKCNIKDLTALGDKKDIYIAVATGGTIARMVLEKKRPKIVIAVACERDLSSGITDSFPLPVFGLPNIRPNGPCRDTLVDVNALTELIEKITG